MTRYLALLLSVFLFVGAIVAFAAIAQISAMYSIYHQVKFK